MALEYATTMSWLCFFLLGFGGWNVLNSLFLESPLFYSVLPEGANITTSLSISQQIASIIVMIPTQIWSNGAQRFYPHIIISTLVLSCISCVIIMYTALISIDGFSLPLLFMAVITSMIGYISTTYYFPFVSLYKGVYTNAYSMGLGFSLAFTASTSLIQDSGSENPRFGYKTFFLIILVSNLLALFAGLWLIFSPTAKTQLLAYKNGPNVNVVENMNITSLLTPLEDLCAHKILERDYHIPMTQQQHNYYLKYPDLQFGQSLSFSSRAVLKQYWSPSFYQFVLGFLGFGIIPGLLPYAACSYFNGNTIYMYSVFSLYIVDPFARLIYSLNFKELSCVRHLNVITGICFTVGLAIIALACLSPYHLPFRDSLNGGILPIVLAGICGFTFASAFTGSYTLMFNLGSACNDVTLCQLQNKKEAHSTTARDESKPFLFVINNDEQVTQLESNELGTNDETVYDSTTLVKTGSTCLLCVHEAQSRDQLRQMIYRLSGFGFQIGSFLGTLGAASLTVISGAIPEPSMPLL